ncbi:extensin family protein [Devosia chinhatensis]|uniref:extensin family protein n=1 Tax=Devosia chinhatensis TaxID=429727 RepID=UPI000696ED26|nr:extensin family protein [Devosia chinhatensis]
MRAMSFALAILLAAAPPLAAQDIFQPLQDLVEELVPQRAAPRPAPEPVRPVPPTPAAERPGAEAEEPTDAPPLPRPRPEDAQEAEIAAEPEPDTAAPASGVVEPSASAEPDRVYQTACPALLSGRVVGEMLPPITEGICEERSPLSVNAVSANGHEIGFSSPVTTNCAMADALADWVAEVDAYATAALKTPVTTLNTGTSMMCRNRNGGDESFVSEHGFANALDVVGFTLEDGTNIAVEADWLPASAPEGRLLRQAHGAACARFTTVLGPEANAEHEDHLHLDLGCHGQACTARICE